MIPLRKFIPLLVLVAVVSAACSSSPGLVATVGGDTQITEDDIAALFESESLPVNESLRSTIFALVARVVLLDGMVADFGLALDQAAVDDLFTQYTVERDGLGVSTADFVGVPDASEEMMRFDAEITVLRRQVVEALVRDPAYLEALLAQPALFTRVCSSHILVATEDEALGVIERLAGGADFAAVADEVSLDTGAGGDLGCRIAGEYVTSFAQATVDAPIGEVFGPVESEFGWHVLTVRERTAPTAEEVSADPLAVLPSTEATAVWQEWFNDKLQEADVVVEAKFGTWSPVGIVPPA